jgi:isopenicillin N synthase-like dioxygenase
MNILREREGEMTKRVIPVVDGKQLLSRSDSVPIPKEICDEIVKACKACGFFQLINSGVDPTLINTMFTTAAAFFQLPTSDKLTVQRTASNYWGYTNSEFTKQIKDLKEVYDMKSLPRPDLPPDHPLNYNQLDGINKFPYYPPTFQITMQNYLGEMTRVSKKLTQALCIGLGVAPDSLEPLFQDDHNSFLRLNYYPAQEGKGKEQEADTLLPVTLESQDKLLGIQRHTDAGFLTVLVQDTVPGLEVWFEDEQQWCTVPPLPPGSLVVNVGDMAQVLFNDIIKAPIHRVAAPLIGHHDDDDDDKISPSRYSAPFFYNPRPDAIIAPMEQFYHQEAGEEKVTGALYNSISWKEFRMQRFKGDYADVGEEIQIQHFRIR